MPTVMLFTTGHEKLIRFCFVFFVATEGIKTLCRQISHHFFTNLRLEISVSPNPKLGTKR